jgi:hypothetical protein
VWLAHDPAAKQSNHLGRKKVPFQNPRREETDSLGLFKVCVSLVRLLSESTRAAAQRSERPAMRHHHHHRVAGHRPLASVVARVTLRLPPSHAARHLSIKYIQVPIVYSFVIRPDTATPQHVTASPALSGSPPRQFTPARLPPSL